MVRKPFYRYKRNFYIGTSAPVFKCDDGQSSIDFIVGFGIFLLTFIFAISFVAGLFTPFQPGAIDLSSVAYRTGTILLEDPGWYIHNGSGGHLVGDPGWETVPTDDVHSLPSVRMGLADSKIDPNVISIDKVRALNRLVASNYSLARDSMGLTGTSSGITYDYKINLVMINKLNGSTVTLLDTACPSAPGEETEKITRNVMVDWGKYMYMDAGTADPNLVSPVLQVDIQNMTTRDRDLKILLNNDISSSISQKIINISIVSNLGNIMPLSGTDYSTRVNGNERYLGYSINKGDVVEIIIYSDAIQDPNIVMVDIIADGTLFPTSYVDYANDKVYGMKSFCYPGLFKLEVWSNEYF